MKLISSLIKEHLLNENEYVVYHSSNKKFSEFKLSQITNLGGDLYGEGFYFTNNYEYSRKFGKHTYKCVIRLDNPLNLTNRSTKDQLYQLTKNITNIPNNDLEYINDSIEHKNFTSAFRKIRKYISFNELSNLFDGVIGYCEEGGKEYVVYNPNNIKAKENINEVVNKSTYIYHGTGKGQALNIQRCGFMKPNNVGEEQPSISFTNDLNYAYYYAKAKGGVSKMCVLRTKLTDDFQLSSRIVNNKGDEYVTYQPIPSSALEILTTDNIWKQLNGWDVIFNEPL